jgi:predicted glycoside hydrolase/deacetylase ChbG (UPF0249 family)
MKQILLIALLLTAMPLTAFGQATSSRIKEQSPKQTLTERLGYPPDAKLLIIHADDLGMAHSVNAASIKALESGLVNSASIMVPCPWFAEVAAYARSHPEVDFGVHLTLTSEWTFYRWGPVLFHNQVATLVDRDGYLYATAPDAAAHADSREVEAEMRAQIERAKAFGIRPTHLDSHMGTLFQNQALFAALLRVAHDNRLPVMISSEGFDRIPYLSSLLGPDDLVIDRMIIMEPSVRPEQWSDFYAEAIKSIQPGVTQIIVHLAYDDEEMRAATIDHPDWGAAWRQRDFEFFTSARLRDLLRENNIKLITWREIGKLIAKP